MYQLPNLRSSDGLKHAISEVEDGNLAFSRGEKSEVVRNRLAFFEKAGLLPEKTVCIGVVHGTAILRVGRAEQGRGVRDPATMAEADALVTSEPETYLMLSTGDCLPVIIYDPIRRAVGVAHLSWLNTEKQFAAKLIGYFAEVFGSSPSDLQVGIGPCIAKESYIFPAETLRNRRLDWGKFLRPLPENQIAVDLLGFNLAQIEEAGVRAENIETSGIDTAADPRFFSHYRAVRTGEPEGRFSTVAGLVEK